MQYQGMQSTLINKPNGPKVSILFLLAMIYLISSLAKLMSGCDILIFSIQPPFYQHFLDPVIASAFYRRSLLYLVPFRPFKYS